MGFDALMLGPSQYHVPKVVRLRIKDKKVVQGCDVYVGRAQRQGGWNLEASLWANKKLQSDSDEERANSINNYRQEIMLKITSNPTLWIPMLKNMVSQGRPLLLGCWCKSDAKGNWKDIPCHGDVIVELCRETIKCLMAQNGR